MRDQMPLRWIEHAEAKRALAAALFERASGRSWYGMAGEEIADWLARLHRWLAPGATGWKLIQAQPALIRRPACHRARRRGDDGGYSCDW